jgi:ubiquitin carboxyl-terminal hydrolase 10
VNTGNICFANAVLQLLVNLPPPWNLFRELGNLKAQRGAGTPDTGGGATPLVDATVRFFKEFSVKEGSPSTQRRSQPATGGELRADEEKNDDNVYPFEPTYLYDAMKEKRQLKPLLVRSPAHVVTSCY